ncbi:MAG: hypothetical protein O2884_04715 [Chloroflexi bacterium]|nr:hypothetical protein [Chloroflexota bacterium]
MLLLCAAWLAAVAFPGVAAAQDAEFTARVDIPSELLLSTEGTGFDILDVTVRSTGGPVVFTSVGESVTLPIPVTSGRGLLEDTDTGSGTTVKPIPGGHLVRIPIKDAGGSDTIRLLLTVQGLVGTGDAVTGTVTAIDIDLPTRSADLSSVDSRVGTASVKVLGSLKSFPGQSGMTMSISKQADAEALSAFAEHAATLGLDIDDIAFATGFDKTGLDDAIDAITLRLTVGRAWVDAVGVANVRVFRRADDGTVQSLDAPIEDTSAADIQFNASSPNGLSTFVIAAVKAAAAKPTPTATEIPVATATMTPVPIVELPTPTAGQVIPGSTATPPIAAVATPTSEVIATPTATVAPTPDEGVGNNAGLLVGAAAVVIAVAAAMFVVLKKRSA